jgi:uncharacterized Zn finger protein (UPF0148 family)
MSSVEAAAKRREAQQSRQSALISKKLLQGWKMLNEVCPETGTVPLMEEPGTGRRWSAATQKFVNEQNGPVEPAPVSPARSTFSEDSNNSPDGGVHHSFSRSDQPAPESPIMQAQGRWQPPTAAEAKEMQRRQKKSDEWSQTMSQMLLKGWKMLDTLCPVTGTFLCLTVAQTWRALTCVCLCFCLCVCFILAGEVPLMQHPKNGRCFSVATGTFVNEGETEEVQQHEATTRANARQAEQRTNAERSERFARLSGGQSALGRIQMGETKSSSTASNTNTNTRSRLPSPPVLQLSSRQPSKRYIQIPSNNSNSNRNSDSNSNSNNHHRSTSVNTDVYSVAVGTLENKIEQARASLERLNVGDGANIGKCRELVELMTACAQSIQAMNRVDQ